MAIHKVKPTEEKEEKEEVKPKRLTLKEKAKIKADTKAAVRALASLPAPPFDAIIPAPGLSKMSASQLVNYVPDKLTRIDAITEFATCSPATAACQAIVDALFPLAGMSAINMTTAQKSDRKKYTKQLRQMFMLTINSCASLAGGNLSLFLLTAVAVKKKGVKHTKQLGPCDFKVSAKKGKGKIGVSCKAIKFAKNYIIYYGIGDFDRLTWKSQVGSSRQIIDGLTPGQLYGFVMIALGATTGEGEPAQQQNINAPFN